VWFYEGRPDFADVFRPAAPPEPPQFRQQREANEAALAALRAKPPAEAQQDDERPHGCVDCGAENDTVRWVPAEVATCTACTPVASRPSADTETLRRVRELADELDRDSWDITAGAVIRDRTRIAARIRAALNGPK
jgi:hypothetical protein